VTFSGNLLIFYFYLPFIVCCLLILNECFLRFSFWYLVIEIVCQALYDLFHSNLSYIFYTFRQWLSCLFRLTSFHFAMKILTWINSFEDQQIFEWQQLKTNNKNPSTLTRRWSLRGLNLVKASKIILFFFSFLILYLFWKIYSLKKHDIYDCSLLLFAAHADFITNFLFSLLFTTWKIIQGKEGIEIKNFKEILRCFKTQKKSIK
jgi:hypothetical protein